MASILVLTCIDPRFTEVLFNYLNHQAQVHSDYDLFVLAGSSLGVIQGIPGAAKPPIGAGPAVGSWPITAEVNGTVLQGTSWTRSFTDHLALALELHQITEVWAFDHLDCGAYKFFQLGTSDTDMDVAPHAANLITLKNRLESTNPTLYFKGFVIHGPEANFRIEKTLDTGGIIIPDPGSTSSRVKNAIIIFLITLFFLSAIMISLKPKH